MRPDRRKLLLVAAGLLVSLACLSGGVTLSTEAWRDWRKYPIQGVVVSSACVDFSLGQVRVEIAWFGNEQLFIGEPVGCDAQCCGNLVGKPVWFRRSDGEITTVSAERRYSTGTRAAGAFVFYVLALVSCSICLCGLRREPRSSYNMIL